MKRFFTALSLLVVLSSCAAYTNYMEDNFGAGPKRTTWAPPDLIVDEGYNYFIVGIDECNQYVNLFYPFEDEAAWHVHSGGWAFQYGAFRRPASPFSVSTHRWTATSSPGESVQFSSSKLFPEMTNRDWSLGGKVIILVVRSEYSAYGIRGAVYDVDSAEGSYFLQKAGKQEPVVLFGNMYRYF